MITSQEMLIKQQMNAIADIFGGWKNETIKTTTLIKLFRRLQAYEFKAHQAALAICNGTRMPSIGIYTDNVDQVMALAEKKCKTYEIAVTKLLQKYVRDEGKVPELFFINKDPRGYALKLNLKNQEWVKHPIHTDWGRYGILAPSHYECRGITDEDGSKKTIWYFI